MTFFVYFGQKRKKGAISLRRKQWEVLILALLIVYKKENKKFIASSASLKKGKEGV